MNPVLETGEDQEVEQETEADKKEEKDDATADEELEVNEDKVDWEEYIEEGFEMGSASQDETDPNKEYYEPAQVSQITLEEHLENQLAERKLSEHQHLLVQFLIGCLDASGYLRMASRRSPRNTGANVSEVLESLQIIWSMEPPGIGARDLQECLRLQTEKKKTADASASLALRIIDEAWEAL